MTPRSVKEITGVDFSPQAVARRLRMPQGVDPQIWNLGVTIPGIIERFGGTASQAAEISPVGEYIPNAYCVGDFSIQTRPDRATILIVDTRRGEGDDGRFQILKLREYEDCALLEADLRFRVSAADYRFVPPGIEVGEETTIYKEPRGYNVAVEAEDAAAVGSKR